MKKEINLTLKIEEANHILVALKRYDAFLGYTHSKNIYNKIIKSTVNKESYNWLLDDFINITNEVYNIREYRYFEQKIYQRLLISNYMFIELRNKIFCSTDVGVVVIEKDNRENVLAMIDNLISGIHYPTIINLHLAIFLLFCDELNIKTLYYKIDVTVDVLINEENILFHILAPINKYTLPTLMLYLIENKKCYDKEVFDYWMKFITIYYDNHSGIKDLHSLLKNILGEV